MPRDPEIRNLQVEIYISTKRRQNPMEFRWFRDRFSIFQKRRVGPTLITRFSVGHAKGISTEGRPSAAPR